MPGRGYSSEEKYNIIMESFQNTNIIIAAICREHGIAVSLFYKWGTSSWREEETAWKESALISP